MKAFISTDLEGLPYIVIPDHLGVKGSLCNGARKIATRVTLVVAGDQLSKRRWSFIPTSSGKVSFRSSKRRQE